VADKNSKNLFRRLTLLFRSGPVIKRRVKDFESGAETSSAFDMFRRNQSHVYSTAMSAYGTYDRMARYSDFCFRGDTLVYTTDGIFTFEELIEKYPEGQRFHVYSYDPGDKTIKISTAHSPRVAKNGIKNNLVRVTLDDGGHIDVTPDHKFLLRSGEEIKAEDLTAGSSLMPFYVKDITGAGYKFIYSMDRNAVKGGWVPEHRIVAEYFSGRKICESEDVHHVDFDRTNNHISNLQIMDRYEHKRYHAQLNNRNKFGKSCKAHSLWMVKNNHRTRHDITFEKILDVAVGTDFSLSETKRILSVDTNVIKRRLRSHGIKNWLEFKKNKDEIQDVITHKNIVSETCSPEFDKIVSGLKNHKTLYDLSVALNCTTRAIQRRIYSNGFDNWSHFKESMGLGERYKGKKKGPQADQSFTYQDVCNAYASGMTKIELANAVGTTHNKVMTKIRNNGFKSYSSWSENFQNHKVSKVEHLNAKDIVYNITVEKYHNLAVGSINPSDDGSRSHSMVIARQSEMEYTPEISSALDIYCLAADNMIPLLNGEIKSVGELFSENIKNFYVYSYDIENKQYVPGLCSKVFKTGENQKIYKVSFDDGTFLRLTENHRVLLRDGTYKRVKDLEAGDATTPVYKKQSSKESGDRLDDYEMIRMSKDKWEYTHRVVSEYMSPGEKGVVHHRDFRKWNNDPQNLQIMSWNDHKELHATSNTERWKNDERYREKMSQIFSDHAKKMHSIPGWTENVFLARRKEVFNSYTAEERKKIFGRNGSQNGMHGSARFGELNPRWRSDFKRTFSKDQIIDMILSGDTINEVARKYSSSYDILNQQCKIYGIQKWSKCFALYARNGPSVITNLRKKVDEYLVKGTSPNRKFKEILNDIGVSQSDAYSIFYVAGYKNFTDFIDSTNHRVVSIEQDGIEDVYDLTIEKYHNFAVGSSNSKESFTIVHNSEESIAADEHGNVLHIHSDNPTVKQLLHELFYDTLNVEFNMTSWVRSLVKYGDFFLFNDVSPEHGVINAYPMPVNEVEREEGYDPDDPLAVRFRWITQGNQALENWQVSHMRLLGNDAFLPYGSSVLESARRIWRQLILVEDAMLVYRVVRSPERRIFYIDVGNVPPEDIPTYMEQVQSTLKKASVVDKDTGRVDLRYNPLPVWKDTPIPLLDGRTVTIEELSKEVIEGKQPWVYSIQDDTHQVVPGKVTWCGKNYTAEKMIKVWLDDDTFVMTAPEHPFVMRDGSSKRADELAEGDCLMPLYRDVNSKGYERCYNPASQSYETTHTLVAKNCYEEKWSSENRPVVHHKEPWLRETNKKNNSPSNLEVMDFWEHRKWHIDQIQHTLLRPENLERAKRDLIAYNKSDAKRRKTAEDNRKYQKAQKMGVEYNGSNLHKEHNKIRRSAQLKSWANNKEKRSAAMKMILPKECIDIAINTLQNDPSLNRDRLFEAIHELDSFRNAWEKANLNNNRKYERYGSRTFAHQIKEFGYSGFSDFKKQAVTGYRNHKVARIEEIFEPDDVYCMTVVGPHGEDDRHNFAVQSLSKCLRVNTNGIFLLNSVDEDYYLPVRGGESGTKIDTLAGGQNTTAIEDVEYIQKKLFAALKIPKAYLGYDEGLGAKSTLCLRGNTKICLVDGRRISIKDIVSEFNEGKKLKAYSYDHDNRRTTFGNITNAWATKEVTELYKITLDSGEVIECTSNHPFLMKDGLYTNAEDLSVDESVMPHYTKYSSKENGDLIDGYEMIWQNGEWKYAHKELYDHHVDGKYTVGKMRVLHHKDFNKLNNDPENLQEMTWYEHRKYHSDNLETSWHRPDVVKRRKASVLKWLKSEKHKDMSSSQMKFETTTPGRPLYKWIHGDKISDKMSQAMKKNWENKDYRNIKVSQLKEMWKDDEYRKSKSGENHWISKKYKNYKIDDLIEFCKENNITQRKEFLNIPKDIRPFGSRYLMKLLNQNGYSRWRDFAKDNINYNHKIAKIEIIKLDSPEWVYDITVDDHHNFALAAGIFVHNSQEDIRFSRTIARIQRTIVAELNKIAIIHLFCNGFEGEDLLDFTLQLSNPSTIAQQQKLELFRSRFEIAGLGTGIEGLVDREWIRRNIFNMTKEDVKSITSGIFSDRLMDLKVEAVHLPGEESDHDDLDSDDPGIDEPPAEEPGGATDLALAGDDRNSLGMGLLTASGVDESDEIDLSMLSIHNEMSPITAQGAVDRLSEVIDDHKDDSAADADDKTPAEKEAEKRKRRRHSNDETDHLRLVSHDRNNASDSITHPDGMKLKKYKDRSEIRNLGKISIPALSELDSSEFIDMIDDKLVAQHKMTSDIKSTLKSLGSTISNRRRVISESDNSSEED
tara:strand:- start:8386 stop:15345 length:6960 start_codon:yes stop_codon:yes gene_type:complete